MLPLLTALLATLFCVTLFGKVCQAKSFATKSSPARAALLRSENSLRADSSESTPSSGYEGWTTTPLVDRGRQSPTAAMFKSLLVPGLGQIGNRKYLKAALVISGETFLFLRWLDFRNQTVDARAALEAENDTALRGPLFTKFDNVRDQRNLYAWLTGTAIFASMIDAFVDAHLAKFPAPENKLSLNLTPAGTALRPLSGFAAEVTWRF